MVLGQLETQIVEHLAKLSGLDFQEEVSALLARNIESFQPMPETQEGGLDGLSHNQTVSYCCFGLKESTIRSSTRNKLCTRICNKFQGDLRKLFELKQDKASGELIHAPNELLGKIRMGTQRIRNIRLIVNSFEDPAIAGRLQKAKDRYAKVSKNRHVDPGCSVVVEGPKELILRVGVGLVDLYHIEAKGISALFARDYSGEGHEKELDRFKLDDKMDALAAANPSRTEQVEALRDTFYRDWIDYVGMMTHLDADHPRVYEQLLELERTVSAEAHWRSMGTSPGDMPTMVGGLTQSIQQSLERDPPISLSMSRIRKYAGELTAYLVCDCALDWRPQDAS